jgi:hypothetical protein
MGADGAAADGQVLTTRRRAILGLTAAATGALLTDAAIHPSAAHAEGVTSVNGKTGAVVLGAADVEAAPASEIMELAGENTAIGEGAFASFVGESKAEHEKHRGNTAYGWHALHSLSGTSLTSTEDNTAIGSQALGFLTTGGGNTAVGENAGVNLTSGEENTVVGCEALAAQQTTSNNVAVGFRAAGENKTGTGITVLGNQALEQGTAGAELVAIGHKAMQENTGSKNVGIGFEALRKGSGNSNTVVGTNAGKSFTTGGENTLVGIIAGQSLTTGNENSYFGAAAGANSQTASKNTAIGQEALLANTTGERNVALGYSAGETNTGSSNIFIGNHADASGAVSNKLVIANNTTVSLISGVMSATAANQELAFYGAAPVKRHATIAVPAEETKANTKAIKEIIEAIKAIGIIL